jgi:predicted AlkP superfamily pyrophosphatase or phosphodiesterase
MRRNHARLAVVAALIGAHGAVAAPVLMISVDGMKPEYVLDADSHGLKIPFLRGMQNTGTYARGVTAVWPTVTYPNHTTLVTGVWPAEHGIYNNLEFDPKHNFAESWFWYALQIRVPTLWQAARAAGLATASVGWPATVGSGDVDFLIPEFWRIFRPTPDLNPSDADLIAALSRPEGMLVEMQSRLGPFMAGNDPSPPGDEIKSRFALDILRARKPQFMTIHLSSLDEEQHSHGPFSVEADQALETLDGDIAQLVAAARSNDPATIALVVSDHGFTPLTHRVNLMQAFVHADLIRADGTWRAQPWVASGMAAIMLRDPADAATLLQVRELLKRLSADSSLGIAEVLERDAIQKRGAFPDASFLVVMQAGYYVFNDASAPLVSDVHGTPGGHGFSPEFPEMRASFFIEGPGIAHHRDLGIIDMRRIAPTVAQLLNVKLPSAVQPPLPVRP